MPRGCPKWARDFGRNLHHWLYHAGFRALPEEYDTWLAGGCWLLAQALHQWIGGPSELWAIYSEVGSDVLHPDVIPQHVVVRIGDCYLDGDGASNEKELLERWEKEEGLAYPELRPAKIEELGSSGIECPADALRVLVEALEQTFGSGLQAIIPVARRS